MNGTFIAEVRRRRNPTAAGFVGDDFVIHFICHVFVRAVPVLRGFPFLVLHES